MSQNLLQLPWDRFILYTVANIPHYFPPLPEKCITLPNPPPLFRTRMHFASAVVFFNYAVRNSDDNENDDDGGNMTALWNTPLHRFVGRGGVPGMRTENCCRLMLLADCTDCCLCCCCCWSGLDLDYSPQLCNPFLNREQAKAAHVSIPTVCLFELN